MGVQSDVYLINRMQVAVDEGRYALAVLISSSDAQRSTRVEVHLGVNNKQDKLVSADGSHDNVTTFKVETGRHSNELLTYLINQGISIQSFQEVLPGLNEIFIKLVTEASHLQTNAQP